MKKFKPHATALALCALYAGVHAQPAAELERIDVTGAGDRLGTGLLIEEDGAKARSSVTRAMLEKQRGGTNPFQSMSLLPGVNTSSNDATGLFGGNLRVRGFNSDQMGFTINGAPVNDSGSFSVFPQEYADSENLCELFLTQGATDTEAPHVGASGGNVGLTTCGPLDTHRLRVALTAGQLRFGRGFVRVDTGKIGDFKGFISYSKSQAQKWKGRGKADRDHIDAVGEHDLGGGSKLTASLLYNRAVNNNFRALTLTQLANEGYFADYATTPPQHLAPVNGKRQAESFGTAYYGYSLNPFRNWLFNAKARLQLSERARLDIEPYFWYGFGTGGTQQTAVSEGVGGNRLHGGVVDLNGDGDSLDTVMIYRSSVTQTYRPGVTTKFSYNVDNHKILAGFWYERARHRQTGPGTFFDNMGNVGDIWLHDDTKLIRYADGALYQNRDTFTLSTGKSVFIQDTIDLDSSRLQLVPSLSWRSINRNFTNYPSSGGNAAYTTTPFNGSSAAFYTVDKTYSEVLPGLGATYQFAPQVQGFASLSKNFKAPGNFEYFGLANGVRIANGVGTAASLAPLTVNQETSINLDTGVRYRGDMLKGSATVFLVKFKNRIASSYDPSTASSHDWNVGDSTIKGLELEAGTVPVKGFSGYASLTYTRSTIDSDMPASATTTYPTAGKIFPDTPKRMAGLSLQYARGPFLVNLSGKYTGGRYLTLLNDVSIGGFTTFDLNAAYKLPVPPGSGVRSALVRLNISNLTSRKFLSANSGSGSLIAINAAGNPQVYPGAPRFATVTLQADF